MSQDQLEALADIFPQHPRSELATRLLCATNFETLVDELFLEQSQSQRESTKAAYSADVLLLKEMFPDQQLDKLAAELQKRGDIQKVMDALVETDWRVHCATLHLDADTMQPLVDKHNGDFLVAFAELVGRRSALPHPHSTQAQELKRYVGADRLLHNVNSVFLEKCLHYYNDDVFMVLEAARMYIEAGRESVTFERKLGLERKPEGTILSSQFTFNLPKPTPPGFTEAPKRHVPASAKPARVSARAASPAIRLSTLDLHGYTVADALAATQTAVSQWWATELEERTAAGIMSRYGQKADHVLPLNVITGRGIHSVDGTSRVRASVIRMLEQKGYLIELQAGLVTVVGKRK